MKFILILFFLMFTQAAVFGQDIPTLKSSKPFVLGTTLELSSAVLNETRTVNVYLPAGYSDTDAMRFPVIYLLDGSADEDFIHISGLVQFMNFPWVNSIPESIVVGIANIDRRRDLTYPTTIEKDKKDFPTTGGSANFISFLEKELQPFIDRHYKTNTTRTVVGQSLGGLVATEILFKRPQLFSKYVIVSPSLWWDNESLLQYQPAILQPAFKDSLSVFIAVGEEGKRMIGDARKLFSMMGQGTNIKAGFKYFTEEDHASIMHNAAYKGLEFVNGAGVKK
jgi:predicted alpha/beta superfamily hydrolase